MTKIRYAVLVLTIACAAALSARTLSVQYGDDKIRTADLKCPDAAGFPTVVWFHGGDPKKVFVAGHSAGGYLTGMVGLDPEWLGKYGHTPSELAGLVPVSGQMTEHSAVRKANGDDGHRFLQRINARAPLHWVSAKAPPVLAVTGASSLDMPTRKEQNELLIAALRAVGHADARFVEIPDADHGSVVEKCVPLVNAFVLEISSRD